MLRSERQFEDLVRPHFDALFRAAHRLTRCRHDAEELVQEVCLKAFTQIDQLDSLENVLSWLLRVQYHVFVDGARRLRRSPVSLINSDAESIDDFASAEPNPERLAAVEPDRIEIAWFQLKPRQRVLLSLHAEGFRPKEIGQIVGKSPNAVSVQLHRARSRFAVLLRQGGVSRETFAVQE